MGTSPCLAFGTPSAQTPFVRGLFGSWARIPAILREDDLANVMKAGPAAAARKQAANDAAARTAEAGNVIELD